MKQFDLLVVGGGIAGTFHAYHALQKGLKVGLVEKDHRPNGASVRNFGMVVPSGIGKAFQDYGKKSIEIYRSVHTQCNIEIASNGSVYFASDEDEEQLITELHEMNRHSGYPSMMLSKKECVSRYAFMKPDYARAAIFFPQEISVDPRSFLDKMHAFMRQNPLFTYLNKRFVVDIDSGGNTVKARDSHGNLLLAANLVLCCGSAVDTLYPLWFENAELQLVKLQMLRLKPQQALSMQGNIFTGKTIRRYESFAACPSFDAIKSKNANDAFADKWGVHILLKQDADGSILLGDSHEYASLTDNQSLDFRIRNDVNEYFVTEAKKMFNLKHWDADFCWTGTYLQSKNAGFFQKVVDNKMHILTALGGKGMTISPALSLEKVSAIFGA